MLLKESMLSFKEAVGSVKHTHSDVNSGFSFFLCRTRVLPVGIIDYVDIMKIKTSESSGNSSDCSDSEVKFVSIFEGGTLAKTTKK